jgi:hypothetical protein
MRISSFPTWALIHIEGLWAEAVEDKVTIREKGVD